MAKFGQPDSAPVLGGGNPKRGASLVFAKKWQRGCQDAVIKLTGEKGKKSVEKHEINPRGDAPWVSRA